MYSIVLVVSLWQVSFATLLSLGGHFLVDVISLSNKWCRVAGGHGGSWVTLVFSHCSLYGYLRFPRHLSCWIFITGQNEREETTQDTIVTKSAAFASYEINYLTYITATYTRAKRRWHGATAHAPPRNEGQRLSLGPYRVPVQCAARRPY